MKQLAATALALILASPALAVTANSNEHFAVMDTVGNCSVVDTQPSEASGLKILGDKGGYGSASDAKSAFGSGCKGTIDRA